MFCAEIVSRAPWCTQEFTLRFGHQSFHCLALGLGSDVGVVLKHVFRDVPRQVPDDLISSAALSEISNERMAIVMEAAFDIRSRSSITPSGLQ
jgi:hypothetical protein